MAWFSIPDFIKGWREATFNAKFWSLVGILALSYVAGCSAGAGKAYVDGASTLVGLGYGLLGGAGSMALMAVSIGVPIAFPKFLYDKMAENEAHNQQNAPKTK